MTFRFFCQHGKHQKHTDFLKYAPNSTNTFLNYQKEFVFVCFCFFFTEVAFKTLTDKRKKNCKFIFKVDSRHISSQLSHQIKKTHQEGAPGLF